MLRAIAEARGESMTSRRSRSLEAACISLCGAVLASITTPAGADPLAATRLDTARFGYAASAFVAPVGYGGRTGSLALGMITERERGDASIAVAASVGDPDRWLALDTAVVISSLSDRSLGQAGFGEEGSLAFKLHRNVGESTAVAIGSSAVPRWGGSVYRASNPAGHYVALSHAVPLGNQLLMLSGGAGQNVTNKNGNSDDLFGVDLFAALAWYPHHGLSLIGEYDGYCVNAALSVAPLFRWWPLTLTAGYVDLLSDHNRTPRLTLLASVAYAF